MRASASSTSPTHAVGVAPLHHDHHFAHPLAQGLASLQQVSGHLAHNSDVENELPWRRLGLRRGQAIDGVPGAPARCRRLVGRNDLLCQALREKWQRPD
jgi:hypothetical protein